MAAVTVTLKYVPSLQASVGSGWGTPYGWGGNIGWGQGTSVLITAGVGISVTPSGVSATSNAGTIPSISTAVSIGLSAPTALQAGLGQPTASAIRNVNVSVSGVSTSAFCCAGWGSPAWGQGVWSGGVSITIPATAYPQTTYAATAIGTIASVNANASASQPTTQPALQIDIGNATAAAPASLITSGVSATSNAGIIPSISTAVSIGTNSGVSGISGLGTIPSISTAVSIGLSAPTELQTFIGAVSITAINSVNITVSGVSAVTYAGAGWGVNGWGQGFWGGSVSVSCSVTTSVYTVFGATGIGTIASVNANANASQPDTQPALQTDIGNAGIVAGVSLIVTGIAITVDIGTASAATGVNLNNINGAFAATAIGTIASVNANASASQPTTQPALQIDIGNATAQIIVNINIVATGVSASISSGEAGVVIPTGIVCQGIVLTSDAGTSFISANAGASQPTTQPALQTDIGTATVISGVVVSAIGVSGAVSVGTGWGQPAWGQDVWGGGGGGVSVSAAANASGFAGISATTYASNSSLIAADANKTVSSPALTTDLGSVGVIPTVSVEVFATGVSAVTDVSAGWGQPAWGQGVWGGGGVSVSAAANARGFAGVFATTYASNSSLIAADANKTVSSPALTTDLGSVGVIPIVSVEVFATGVSAVTNAGIGWGIPAWGQSGWGQGYASAAANASGFAGISATTYASNSSLIAADANKTVSSPALTTDLGSVGVIPTVSVEVFATGVSAVTDVSAGWGQPAWGQGVWGGGVSVSAAANASGFAGVFATTYAGTGAYVTANANASQPDTQPALETFIGAVSITAINSVDITVSGVSAVTYAGVGWGVNGWGQGFWGGSVSVSAAANVDSLIGIYVNCIAGVGTYPSISVVASQPDTQPALQTDIGQVSVATEFPITVAVTGVSASSFCGTGWGSSAWGELGWGTPISVSAASNYQNTGVKGHSDVGYVVISYNGNIYLTVNGVEGVTNLGNVVAQPSVSTKGVSGQLAVGSVKIIATDLWIVIDDSQGAIWDPVNDAQSSIWNQIIASPDPGWAEIGAGDLPLWTPVDDTQTPNWVNIAVGGVSTWGLVGTSQSSGWTEINDVQSASWNNTDAAQTTDWNTVNTNSSSWSSVDETQTPNWTDIAA